MKDYLKVLLLFLIVIVLLMFIPDSSIENEKLYISEIMSRNTYTLLDDNNEYSDYIEIYNGYKTKINLDGYNLSDEEFEIRKWTFPDIEINPGEYLIVYASGKDKCDLEKRICHTNFKLSTKGEILTFTDDSGNIISKFKYEYVGNDISFGYLNGKYTTLNEPTPGKENSDKFKYDEIEIGVLQINEYMMYNQRNNYDNSGYYSDWIEFYNNGDSELVLQNIFLTDDESDLKKYKLPKIVMKSNGYLLVYLSDESRIVDNQIYANFKLGIDDKKIIISNGKEIIDQVDIALQKENISYGKVGNSWKYFISPTPGFPNNTKPFDNFGGNDGFS